VIAHSWDRAAWFKSTRSATNGACIEVAFDGSVVGVRDSKCPNGDILEFRQEVWAEFVAAVTERRFEG
jgi:hypothetical protein